MQGQNRMDQKLGNYRLVKLLGKGGYSEVYLAEHIHLELKAAIKVLKARDLDDLEQEKFRAEAKLVMTLEHPRIIKVLDYGIEMDKLSDGSTPYIVMEYAPSGTLRTLYPHRTPMPLQKVALYTRQIADALQYAHDKNIIHQDVKPENMLVRKEDDAALSDFGIAVADLNTSNLQLQQAMILQRNARGEQLSIVGTTPYLAPERLQGHIQRASDQYSLGVVVYEWLAGKRPFEGTVMEICQKHEKEPPPPLAGVYAHISPEVEKVVMKALSKAPADRYKSVRDFATALEGAIQASQPSRHPQPPLFTSNIPSMPMPGTASIPLQGAAHMPYPPSTPPSFPSPNPPPTSNRPLSPHGQQSLFTNNGPSPLSAPPDPAARGGYMGTPGLTPQSSIGNAGNPSWQGGPFQPTGPVQQGFGYTDYVSPTMANRPPGQKGNAQATARSFPDFMADLFENPGKELRKWFAGDKYFLQKPSTRMFYLIGILANLLSALIVLVATPQFPAGVLPAIIGAALSIVLLWRCTVSLKKPVAITLGVGVALWWGIAVLLVTSNSKPEISFLGFIFTFLISSGIHVWYVNNRLKQ